MKNPGPVNSTFNDIEGQYKALFNQSPLGVFVFDVKYKITECNDQLIKFLKTTRQQLIGLDLSKINDKRIIPVLTKALEGKDAEYLGYYEATTSPAVIFGQMKTSPLLDKFGNVIGGIGAIVDLTDYKKTQIAFQESEEKYRLIVETITDGLLLFDCEGNIVDANISAHEMHGYKKDEMIGLTGKDIVYHKELHKFNKFLNDTAEEKEFYCEAYDLKKDGTRFPVDVKGIYFPYKGEQRFLAVIRDITERRQVEEKLKKSEEKYRNIFEKANVGIFQTTYTGKLISANSELAKMLGYKNINELFASLQDIERDSYVEPEKRKEFLQLIIKQGYVENFEYQIYRKDRTKIWVLESSLMSKKISDGDFIIDGFVKDITDRKRAIELKNEIEITKRTSKLKDQFLANISHEIRTPLTGIIGMTEILFGTNISKQQQEYLDMIKDSSQVLMNLINDILDISKIEAGKMELKPEPFDIKESVVKIKTFFETKTKNKNVNFSVHFDETLPDLIIADKKRFEQILMNLLSNACKFTHKGSIKIKVKLIKTYDDISSVKVNVIDTGIGIKSEDQDKLFDKFSQVDSSNTRSFEGSGLGLAICKELIKMMGGEIGFTSREGKGSDFWIIFDSMVTDKKDLIEYKTDSDFVNSDLNFDILIVEDKIESQKVLKLILEDVNCRIDIANNGFEALEAFKSGKYDLIIMDIMMPQMDGLATLKKLKKKYKKLPPVIGISAYTIAGDAEKYVTEGFDDYITKPVTKNQLYSIVLKWGNKTNK